jgi:DNA-binding NarL/FixJ family response regulator
MNILLLEDDHLQAEQVESDLRGEFPRSQLTIELIKTEYEFRNRLKTILLRQPDVIILDIMVRWHNPVRNIPNPPEEVIREKHFRAGLRCLRLLAEIAPAIPVILYSVLDIDDLEPELQLVNMLTPPIVLTKEPDSDQLIHEIRKIIAARAKQTS